jgi:hypothetical protein
VAESAAGSNPAALPSVMWGTAAALFTVTIWGGWIVATRFGVTSNLAPFEIAILRTIPPGLILLPVFLRIPWRAVWARHIAAMVIGVGAPHMLVVSSGMQFAPVADVGALLPGTMPLFVALFAFVLLGERLDRWRPRGGGGLYHRFAAIRCERLASGRCGEYRADVLAGAGGADLGRPAL